MKQAILLTILVLGSIRLNAQIQTGVFRNPPTNTDYNFFVRRGGGAALYVNQADSASPILRLGSKTTSPGGGLVFSVENNGYVGIKTITPQAPLHIAENDASINTPRAAILLSRYWASATNARAGAIFEYSDGAKDKLVLAVSGNGGALTTPIDISQAKMTIQADGNIGIGTTTPGEKLSVNGNIRAKEIKVETANWPDYVFKPDYPLIPLNKVESFIKENGHLPGVLSAKEVAEKGVAVGANQAILLKKIEELTLHMIRLEKENATLKNRLQLIEDKMKDEVSSDKN
ncbi:hypothetical protein A8C56_02795 [Niabella ginsenosidivorans]|uniref:Peptidase S74 domain-containing protein n=1 Tax=Niabella ginsenosidivorans TaxID=1176587 RepID=A0A1A9I001_9BACT|nr:hypothetical protein [Niabella ginsenosidivorans]ANH80051.1 hypothetical protein A8C56_02795 [Niabella ginsenosidivorans]